MYLAQTKAHETRISHKRQFIMVACVVWGHDKMLGEQQTKLQLTHDHSGCTSVPTGSHPLQGPTKQA